MSWLQRGDGLFRENKSKKVNLCASFHCDIERHPLPVPSSRRLKYFLQSPFLFLLFKGQALGRSPCTGRSYCNSLREGNITWLCLACEGRFKGGTPAFFRCRRRALEATSDKAALSDVPS